METTPPPVPFPAPSNSLPPQPVAKWRWWFLLLVVGPYPVFIGIILPQILSQLGLSLKDDGPALGRNSTALLIGSAITFLTFAVPMAIAWWVARPSLQDLGLRRSTSKDWPTWIWLIVLGLLTLGWMVVFVGIKMQDYKKGADIVAYVRAMLDGAFFVGLFTPPVIGSIAILLIRRFTPAWISVPTCQGAVYSVLLRLAAGAVVVCFLLGMMLFKGISIEEATKVVQDNQPKVENLVSKDALQNDWAYLLLGMTVVSFVVAGFREELWRSATMASMEKLFPNLRPSLMGKAVLLLVPAIVFGLGHYSQGAGGIILTGIIGIGCGALILFQRNAWTAIMAHGFLDASTFAMLPYALEAIKKAQQATGQ